MDSTGVPSIYLFLSIMLLLLPFFIKQYLKTKAKGYLLLFIGILTTLVGFFIDEPVGKFISFLGYIIFMTGYFVNAITPSGVEIRKNNRKNLFYHPVFLMVSIILLSIFFMAWGIYNINLNGTLLGNVNGIVPVLFGIASIIYAIISYKKRE